MIASFYHGFQCSPKDIADVVRMSEGTLMARLIEMRQTPLALMSREDFERKDPRAALADQTPLALPPCFVRSRKASSQKVLLDDQLDAAALADKRTASAAEVSSGAVDDAERMPPPPKPKTARGKNVSKASEGSVTSGALAPSDESSAMRYTKKEPTAEDIESIAREITSHHSIQAILEGKADPSASRKVETLVAGKPDFAPESDKQKDAARSEGGEDEVEESLGDVDDEELEKYLLDKEEEQTKTAIWHEVNKDYLEEWHVRGVQAKRRKQDNQAKKEAEASASEARSGSEAAEDSASERSSSRKSRRGFGPASSCTESAIMGLTKKGKVKLSNINIAALESLFS